MERKITIEEKISYREDYQMRMLKANHLDGILNMGGRGVNGNSCYDYDVSGKMSMRAMYERSKISAEDIKIFLRDFKMAVKEVEIFLLNINCILLKPEYIFYEDEKYYFCYYPPAKGDVWEEFHRLTEYFVKQADYQDQECISMVFLLHQKTMDENYSLEKLAAECLQNYTDTENNQDVREKQDGVRMEENFEEYDRFDHDWIAEQEMGSSILRETENLWTPVKRFLNKRKKSKWGEWDGLHIEEEEL